jgi:hypothetical protein
LKWIGLPDVADSGLEGDLPVKSIALRCEARKSLKAFTDYDYPCRKWSQCFHEIKYQDYADGKILCSWSPPDDSVDSIEFNINNRGSLRQGGVRAYLCSWSEHFPHMTFYPQQMFEFFLLPDKCSMPAPGVNELSWETIPVQGCVAKPAVDYVDSCVAKPAVCVALCIS